MSSTNFIGSLRGEKILFPRVLSTYIEYHKRSRDVYRQLRANFSNVERVKFLKSIVNSPSKKSILLKAGLTLKQIDFMRQGILPDGWQVHHKLPLDDNGTNDFSNLLLIKNDPYHMALTNEQSKLTKGLKVGETRRICFPLPIGFVLVPENEIAKFKRLENKASLALHRVQLIGIATHANSPLNAWRTASDLGWADTDCESVEALATIYSKYGQTAFIDLIKQKASYFFFSRCFCQCHRDWHIENCNCCNLYSNRCFCSCHFCYHCDTNQKYCERNYNCGCSCHNDTNCCNNCASFCWCICHNCSECYSLEGNCGGASNCNCICHESCNSCSNNHQNDDGDDDDDNDEYDGDDDDDNDEYDGDDDDDNDEYDGDDDDDNDEYDGDDEYDDNDIQVEQTSQGIFNARLLDQNKDVAGYFKYKREGNGFRCLSITWQGMNMNSITITNNRGQTQIIYDGDYFNLILKGGGTHNFHQ
jgi:hypothetical protein